MRGIRGEVVEAPPEVRDEVQFDYSSVRQVVVARDAEYRHVVGTEDRKKQECTQLFLERPAMTIL